MDIFDGLLREALVVCAVLCLPILGIAALVGTLIAIVQAATSVQEQTLTLLPKLVIVALMVAVFGRFGMGMCAQLFADALGRIPAMLGSLS